MSDENQIEIPPSFIALFVEPGRTKPSATREAITERYEFCEALATMLVERAQTLQWQLGITEADVLEKLHAGLQGPTRPCRRPRASGSSNGWPSCSSGIARNGNGLAPLEIGPRKR